MATHSIPDLWPPWVRGEFSAEQAVGHILQNLLAFFQRQTELERRVRELEQRVAKPQA